MDKNQLISDKINKLISEGKDRSQASAIAFSMYQNIKQNESYQQGGQFTNWLGSLGSQTWDGNVGQPQATQIAQQSPGGFTPQQFNSVGSLPNTPPIWQQPVMNTPVNTNLQDVVTQQPTTQQTQPVTQQRGEITPFTSSLKPAGLTYGTPTEQLQASVQGSVPNMTQSTNESTQQVNTYEPNEKIQFFNPYGNFDIPTAASFLGASVENKDALGIAGSGLKLATGLARNFFGGMGLQNRNNQVMKDYYEKQRNDLTRPEVLQEGGNFSDIFPGNSIDLGINSMNTFPQFTEGNNPVEGEITPFTNTMQSPYQAPEDSLQNQPYSIYQDGGVQEQDEMQQIEQQIVQALQQGIDPEVIIQNLVEQGMPEQQVIQMVQQIIQQTQSQEQAPQQEFMQNGGKMSLAKGLTGEYMTGMDKDNPIEEPNAEIENGEYVQHPTGELQKAVGDTHENGGMDVKLADNTKILSDHLKPKIDFIRKIKKDYEIDIKSSDTYSKILDKYSKKIGLSKVVDEQEDLINKMEKVVTTNKDEEALGLNTQYLSGKLSELEEKKKPLEKDRKDFFEKLFQAQEDSKPKEDKEKTYQNGGSYFNDAIIGLAKKYNIPEEEILNSFQKGGTKLPQGKNQNRFDDRYNDLVALGYTGSKNIGNMQAWMNANYPDEVVKYFTDTNQPMTAKHVDIVKDKFRDAFNKAGIPINKDSAKYTEEEKSKLKEALGANATKEFWLEGFNDNKQDWRFPIISGVPGLPARNVVEEQISAPGLPNFYQPVSSDMQSPIVETEEERNRRGANLLLLPNQNPMLPGSLQPHLKINRRFDRINPALISPEQSLQEINRQTVATKERLNLGAGAERIAGELGLSANTQDNINKIVTDTEKLNSQIISNTDARNATIQATEENAAAQDALSYEQRQLTAKAKTDFDINNYYNTLRENNVRDYNKVNDLNLLNQMYNDFQFDGQGIQKTSPNIKFSTDTNPIYKADTTPAKKKKKQDGGRFKK